MFHFKLIKHVNSFDVLDKVGLEIVDLHIGFIIALKLFELFFIAKVQEF